MKLAIITGASRGIGAATAQRFVSAGYQTVSVSRAACGVSQVQSLQLDLRSDSSTTVVIDTLREALEVAEQIVVVHNAASLVKDSATSLEASALTDILALNVVVPARLNQALIPFMKTGSSVVFVGSTLSRKAVANSCSYVTSKHALMGLMRATCQDLAGSGVHTTMVMPGFTDTEMLRSHIGYDDSIVSALSASVAMGRLVQPEEIAETIWIASQNPVLNGAEIDANLGQIEH